MFSHLRSWARFSMRGVWLNIEVLGIIESRACHSLGGARFDCRPQHFDCRLKPNVILPCRLEPGACLVDESESFLCCHTQHQHH